MLQVQGLRYRAGNFALQEVSLDIEAGEYFALLGPTGSGKTLLIQNICGLIRADGGSILIEGRDVTRLAPRMRDIGYVPQDYGLFPHLNVERNVVFGLRARGVPMREARERIRGLVETLQLGRLLNRSTRGLSGGERQKVALARALAIRPKLLMLDEPVSALDESIRQTVCAELCRLQRELRIATVHVTHSFEEALAVSDRAGIMREGRLVQTGPMSQLMRRPADEGIARFLRIENIFRGRAISAHPGGTIVEAGGRRIAVPGQRTGEVVFMIRPTDVEVSPASEEIEARGENAFVGELAAITERGAYSRLEFNAGITIVTYAIPGRAHCVFETGGKYLMTLPREAIHVFDNPMP
ncbi:MAG TPA: ABC transporter ATP-binding protein [Candidatus Brocadiia bacterium]|nr:ABC transporter ATP-binding protein [Candidatus Brocadiia bacterium]